MKILAIKLRAIGDSVIWTAALRSIHQAWPGCEIQVLTYQLNADVFKNLEYVNQVNCLNSKSRWELVRALWGFRREHFDWLLGFHASTSLCRWAWLAGAGQMALHHHSFKFTPKGSVEIEKPGILRDAISRDYEILKAIGIRSEQVPTQLVVSEGERERGEAQVRAAIERVGGDVNRERMMFLPGAGHHLRRYPKDLWLNAVMAESKQGVLQPVAVVDEALAREWNLDDECLKLKLPLVITRTLREFIVVISRGQRALANDSGPGHISVALGLRTGFIFGPGCVGDWHCYDPKVHPLYRVSNLSCRLEGPREQEVFQYCTINECEHHRCMKEIRLNL